MDSTDNLCVYYNCNTQQHINTKEQWQKEHKQAKELKKRLKVEQFKKFTKYVDELRVNCFEYLRLSWKGLFSRKAIKSLNSEPAKEENTAFMNQEVEKSNSKEISENCLTCYLKSNGNKQVDTFYHVKNTQDIINDVSCITIFVTYSLAIVSAFIWYIAVCVAMCAEVSTNPIKIIGIIAGALFLAAGIIYLMNYSVSLGITYSLDKTRIKLGANLLINNIFKYILEKNKDDLSDLKISTTALNNIIINKDILNKIAELIYVQRSYESYLFDKKESIIPDRQSRMSLENMISEEKENLNKIKYELAEIIFDKLQNVTQEQKHKDIIKKMKTSYICNNYTNDCQEVTRNIKKLTSK